MSEPVIKELLNILPQVGEVVSIIVRPERKQTPVYKESVHAEQGKGLKEDHFKSMRTKREVTLIQAEHLTAVSSILGVEASHDLTRRNIMVKGINLLALKGQQFQIGEAIFEVTGECHPCSRMEEHFGPGGYNTMRGHGGITAKIIQSGTIRLGDRVNKI